MDNQRVFLAVALSIGVLLTWQYFFAPPPPSVQPGDPAAQEGQLEPGKEQKDGQPAQGAQLANNTNPVIPARNIPDKNIAWETEGYRAVFTNKGARLKSYHLISPDQYTARMNMLLPPPEPGEDGEPSQAQFGDDYLKYLPMATTFGGGALQLPEDAQYEVVEETEAATTFRYTDPQGSFVIDKRYVRGDKLHAFDLEVTVKNVRTQGSLEDQLFLVHYGMQPAGEGEWSLLNPLPDVVESLCEVEGDVERAPKDDAAEGPRFQGPVRWGGITSRYFIVASIPQGEGQSTCRFDLEQGTFLRSAMGGDKFRIEPGQSRKWTFTNYVGPKQTEAMEVFNVGLEDSVDYGIFAFLSKPIHWGLVFFHGFVGNWGIAIILLTFVLRMLMFPINQKSYKNMEGMRKISEPMKEMREKYKDDPAKLQQETMNLYKEHGVNPLGCLPMLLQMPIFFALYRTIYNSVEMYSADFVGWYTDLSTPDPYYVLPALVGLMMFGQQRLMPSSAAADNPQMKIMMWMMPIMFGAFTFVLPSALALYMFVSIGLGILQQAYIRRNSDAASAAAAA